jgi:hypothetical protein
MAKILRSAIEAVSPWRMKATSLLQNKERSSWKRMLL